MLLDLEVDVDCIPALRRTFVVSINFMFKIFCTEYIISYSTTASNINDGNVTVKGGSTTCHTLTNLEGNTPYIITVQATASDSRKSALSNKVSIRTGKSLI